MPWPERPPLITLFLSGLMCFIYIFWKLNISKKLAYSKLEKYFYCFFLQINNTIPIIELFWTYFYAMTREPSTHHIVSQRINVFHIYFLKTPYLQKIFDVFLWHDQSALRSSHFYQRINVFHIYLLKTPYLQKIRLLKTRKIFLLFFLQINNIIPRLELFST